MANGTWDEAKVCPKCGLTGEVMLREKRPVPIRDEKGNRIPGVTPGAVLHSIYCRNKRCRWYNTSWQVQVNPDGTIPADDRPRDKQFPKVDQARAEAVRQNLQALQEATLHGGEIRGR